MKILLFICKEIYVRILFNFMVKFKKMFNVKDTDYKAMTNKIL